MALPHATESQCSYCWKKAIADGPLPNSLSTWKQLAVLQLPFVGGRLAFNRESRGVTLNEHWGCPFLPTEKEAPPVSLCHRSPKESNLESSPLRERLAKLLQPKPPERVPEEVFLTFLILLW